MASRAIDTVITFRVLKLLTMKWEDHEAFGMGIIDEKGKRNKTVKIDSTEKERSIHISSQTRIQSQKTNRIITWW